MARRRRYRRKTPISRAERKKLATAETSLGLTDKKLEAVELTNAKAIDANIVDALRQYKVYSSSSSDETTDESATDEASLTSTEAGTCAECKRKYGKAAERRGIYSERHRRARRKIAPIPFEDPEFVFLYDYVTEESDFGDGLPVQDSDSEDFEEDFVDDDDAYGDYDFYEEDNNWIDIEENAVSIVSDVADNTANGNAISAVVQDTQAMVEQDKNKTMTPKDSGSNQAVYASLKGQRKVRSRRRKSAGSTESVSTKKQINAPKPGICKCVKLSQQQHETEKKETQQASRKEKRKNRQKNATKVQLEQLEAQRQVKADKSHGKQGHKSQPHLQEKLSKKQRPDSRKHEAARDKTYPSQSRRQKRLVSKSNRSHKPKC